MHILPGGPAKNKETNEGENIREISLEWQTCDSDAEWQNTLQGVPTIPTPPATRAYRPNRFVRYWPLFTASLLILAVTLGWLGYVAQQGVAEIEGELRDRVELELWTEAQNSSTGLGRATGPMTITVHLLALYEETAVVQIIMQPTASDSAFRQTRVYQQSDQGWQRIPADPAFWGEAHTLETTYLVFHYYALDEAAVEAVAAQLDQHFQQLATTFQLRLPAESKIQLRVDPAHAPGAINAQPTLETPLVVASPAIYLAPIELSDEQILAQSLALNLLFLTLAQTNQQQDTSTGWQPPRDGMRLWRLWKAAMPLATWREFIVTWVFTQTGPTQIEIIFPVSHEESEFCELGREATAAGFTVIIPVVCQMHPPEQEYLVEWSDAGYSSLGYTVVWATVAEYVEITYGAEKVALLAEGLKDKISWRQLAPQLLGVTPIDFESGWRSYLTKEYKITWKE